MNVLCDVVVLVLFSLFSAMAKSNCMPDSGGFKLDEAAIAIGGIIASIIIGLFVGATLLFITSFKSGTIRFFILPFGLNIFVLCTWLSEWTREHRSYQINLEPLLICIVGGFVCTNRSIFRHRLHKILNKAGPYVFLPFFAQVELY